MKIRIIPRVDESKSQRESVMDRIAEGLLNRLEETSKANKARMRALMAGSYGDGAATTKFRADRRLQQAIETGKRGWEMDKRIADKTGGRTLTGELGGAIMGNRAPGEVAKAAKRRAKKRGEDRFLGGDDTSYPEHRRGRLYYYGFPPTDR